MTSADRAPHCRPGWHLTRVVPAGDDSSRRRRARQRTPPVPGQLTIIAGTFGVNELISEQGVIDPGRPVPQLGGAGPVDDHEPVRRLGREPRVVRPAARSRRWRSRPASAGRSPFAFVDDEVAATLDDPVAGIIYLPFLYGTPANPDDSAALVGPRGWHRRGHVLRAIYEGAVFDHRTHVDARRAQLHDHGGPAGGRGRALGGLGPDVSRTTSGSRSAWPRPSRLATLGAAICAGAGVGIYGSVSSREPSVGTSRRMSRFEPDSRRSTRLDAGTSATRMRCAPCAARRTSGEIRRSPAAGSG